MTKQLKSARRFVAAGVMTAFMFVGVANSNAQNIPDGLIAYWAFDGDLNDAVGDSHGEAMGTEDIEYGSGKFGEGIDLDGVDQFVQTPLDNEEMFDFQDGTGFSISAWYKVGEFTKSWQALIAKGEGNRWRVHRRGGETQLTGNGGLGDVPGGTGDITDGEFHHIVLVSDPDNGEVRLYSDGELVSTGGAPSIESNSNPMMIGENPDARNRTWSGIIDDVGIWNRPLTEDEIAFLGQSSISSALQGGGELVPGMIAHWDFDNVDMIMDTVAGLEGEVMGEVEAAEGKLGGAVDLGEAENWIKVDAEETGWLAPASDANAMSVSLWQKLNVVRNSSTFWFRAEAAGSNARNFQAHIPWGNNSIFFDTAGCCGGTQRISKGAADVEFTEWHHFVFIKNEDQKEIWVDGELWHEGTNSGTLFDDWTYLAIGSSGTGDYAAAIVDDFGVWPRAITPEEIALIYNGGAGSPLYSAGGGPRVVAQFSADWTEDEEPAGTFMSGVTAVGDEFLHITDAANGQNGAFTIEDFSKGKVFTDFEMSFRLHMSDSTCCGDSNDAVAGHRPADGMSINIGNDLPETIGLAEEGSGSGIRICFDTWDSGGGEAPAIDVWRGTEGEVGDGDQGGWSGGMLVRQKFNGVTSASEEEKFKDENGDYVWMWTQGEWVDVNIKFLNGKLTINYKGHEVINHDLPAAWEPLVGPNWLFAARTGGANSTHWIDDLSIKLYASTVPLVSAFETNAGGFDAQITDIEEAGVDVDTIKVTLDGEVVETTNSKADGVTSISYAAPELMAANSDHALKIKYTDSNGKAQLLNLDFTLDPYTLVDTASLADASLKGDSGFLVYPTQISSGQGVGSVHGTAWSGAEMQFMGGYVDPDTEEQYLNEADIDSFEGWSWYPEIVETVNQNQDAPGATGNFKDTGKGDTQDREDQPLTGIPGWGDSTDGVATEYIALVDLAAGPHVLGVNSDDGFAATIAPDFRDKAAQVIGVFPGNRGAGSTEFNIYVQEAGLYPLRVLWWEGGGGASVEIYSIVNGDKVLVNDPDVDGSIKAYTIKGAIVDESTLDLAETGRAKITSARPSAGGQVSDTGSYEFVIEGSGVNADSVSLTVDGAAVNADVSKSGSKITVSYTPAEAAERGSAHSLTLTFDEDGVTRAASIDYSISLVPGGALIIETEDFNYEGGGWKTFEETKLGGTYAGLGAETGIDFNNSGNASALYRSIDGNHPGMAANVDNDRGDYVVTSGWKMGWNDDGDWYNYTRDFPDDAIYYDVVGRFSSGGAAVHNSLSIVTGDTLSEDQSATVVGEFRGPRTACWDCFEFYPMTDKTGAPTAVKLGGTMTLRLTKESGNMDTNYLLFSPSAVQEYPPALVSTAPEGAASSEAAIQVVLQKREIALADAVLSVNGKAVDADIATDGDVITITAKSNPSRLGMNTGTISFNGSTVDWNYFYYGDPLSEDGPNPIALWDFNSEPIAGKAIDNVMGLVGELRNGAAYTDDSHEGNAMDFTAGSNQHVHVADGEFLNIASSVNKVSIAFWQKNYSSPSTSSFWAEPGRAMQAHVPWSDGQIYWDTAGCCGAGTQRINADANDIGGWPDGAYDTWHHYVFIKNEDTKEIWIDGELFHDGENINPLPTNINHLNIGGDAGGGNSLRGVIDDFAVFASALTEDQIIALAEGDRSILPAPPAYPMFISASPDAAAADGSAELSVTLYKRADDVQNAQLSVNGQDVATSVATDGTTITITGTVTGLAPGTATAKVSYNGQSNSWDIAVPERAINNGDGTITFNTHLAWEWWDGINGAHPMTLLTDDPRYPDSPDGATFAPSWNTRTALAGGFEGNGRENYGGRMSGILTAPETGTYRFFIASDDHGLLRISTDADPANAVRVAEQTGCCNNFTLDDGGLSGTVDLVAGNQYYMESLLKEGGGGDWMTVAWRMPSEDIDSVPGGNQEGISGKYFTGTVKVPGLPALSSSLSPANGAVGVLPDPTFTLNVSNGATTLDVDSVSISLDGNKLDHEVSEGTWTRAFSVVTQEGATYAITASASGLESGSEHTVSATFTDSAGASTTHEATFTVTDVLIYFADAATVKYIEVEDFNYDGGSYKTFEEVGTGGAYDGLGAVSGIDFNNSGNASEKYRVISGNHPGMTESMWDAGRSGFDMEVDFKMGWNDDGDWYNYTRDFPEGGSYAVYGRFSSGGAAVDAKLSIVTSDATAEDQTIEDVGTFKGPATGGWNNMRFFPLLDDAGALAVVELSGVSTVRLSKVGGNMDANYLAFVPYAGSDDPVDISMPGDAVVPSSDNHPAGEHAGLAFDNNPATKYLNFDGRNDQPSGVIVTTGGGVVTGLGLTSANDAPDRDPTSFVLSGSNDGGATFTEIASGDVPAFGDRFERRVVEFANDTAYTTYNIVFPTTAGPSTCCMQIAEIELLGTAAAGGDAPALSIVNNGDGTVTVTFEGRLEAAASVNGPWQDTGLTSPATIDADAAQQYGRAVLD